VKDPSRVPESGIAVLVKVHGGRGAFNVLTNSLIGIITGPDIRNSQEYIIVDVSGEEDTLIFG
jgi:hypothetical protein